MKVEAFDFDLPLDLIAQDPVGRGESRLLVLNGTSGKLDHTCVRDLPRFLRPGDLLVANDTRVFPARLLGRRVPSGGAVECLPLPPEPPAHPEHPEIWYALMHPGHKLKPGARVVFDGGGRTLQGEVLERLHFGRRRIRLDAESGTVAEAIDAIG